MEEEAAQPLSASAQARLRRWALRSAADYLSKHSSSVENLRAVMLRRAKRRHPELSPPDAAQLVEDAVVFCQTHTLVDDAAYAEIKVRSGVRKGHSRRRIAQTLAQKGVEREAADAALEGADDPVAALALARRRRIGPWRREEADPDRFRKEMALMGRNGFAGEIVSRVLRMDLEEAEDLLAG
ncbi:MAG: recombination regulator RecX [Mesorhizobium amorphae]|nr:MAG: recombination regulator RecX [Mesorhizobium amorphae]